MTKCSFCDLSGTHKIIYEDELLWVVNDVYPLRTGHRLIVPKLHLLSFATFHNCHHVLRVLTRCAAHYNTVMGGLVAYEHGNREENHSAEPSIDHAHIHLLPPPQQPLALGPEWVPDESLTNIFVRCRNEAYHWVKVGDDRFYYTVRQLPSQFFRQLYSTNHCITRWNWKDRAGDWSASWSTGEMQALQRTLCQD